MTYLKRDLTELLNLNEDRVLVVDTGSADSDYNKHLHIMGAQLLGDSEPAIII